MKIVKNILIAVALCMMFLCTVSLGNTNWGVIEKSKEFKKWENLSVEEKQNTIEPSYFNLNLKNTIKRSYYNQLLKLGTGNIDASYNLKNQIPIIVKNQLQTESCWTFSFSSVIETTLTKLANKTAKEISTMHPEYVTTQMFKRDLGTGGNSYLATAYATSGKGPILESDMPFASVYNEEQLTTYLTPIEEIGDLDKRVSAKIYETSQFASISKSIVGDQIIYTDGENNNYTPEEVQSIRKQIKQHIKSKGAISTSMYTDIGIETNGNYISDYYNAEKSAYYCNESLKDTNHAVTIVGWDDNYEISNFKAGKQPKNPGAYIVLNSYGSQFGENGYMYISYDDMFIENSTMGIDDIKEYTDELNKNNIYQYDELGTNQAIVTNSDTIYAANIFNRDINKEEYINEVGISLLATEGVEIYINAEGEEIENTQLVASPGVLETGYHIVKLPTPIKLNSSKFVVKVKYINKENAMIPIETNLKESGFTLFSNYFDNAKANQGESLISLNGTNWLELNGIKIGETITLKNTNNCIKAFTSQREENPKVEVSNVTLNKNTVDLKIGETEKLVENIKPENATNKKVIWTTSDKTVATVENGLITALKEGTVTITVITEDGNKTATCLVNITKNEGEIDPIKVGGISINKENISLDVGKTEKLVENITPQNATNKKVNWTSSDETIATVENGLITAIKEGVATITVITEDGNKTATCRVNVNKEEDIKIEKIELNKKELTIQNGDVTNLVVDFTPENATNKKVDWTSSDETIAKVDKNGIITAIKEGTVIITATTEDGNKVATSKLTITKKNNTEDDIYQENEDNQENQDNKNNKDTTTSTIKLPAAGVNLIIIISIIVLIIIVIILWNRYRRLKDIK